MVSRRQLLGTAGAAAATAFSGCLHISLSVSASKDTLQLPQDSVDVTITNRGRPPSVGSGSYTIYKDVDGELRPIAPAGHVGEAHDLGRVINRSYTWTFTVDNTDPGHSPPHHGAASTLWGLNPGSYVFDVTESVHPDAQDQDLTAEFTLQGEPLDFEPVTDDVEHVDGDLRLYTSGYRSIEDDPEEPRFRFTVSPVDAGDQDAPEVITEQLNQLRPIRDALLHSSGEEIEVYTRAGGEAETMVEHLWLYTGNMLFEEEVLFQYDGESYRVDVEGWTPAEEEEPEG